jgi:crotonobetainyl-CoA:carnitine CoA-transferase CaiB-like acyl-CoA transferase
MMGGLAYMTGLPDRPLRVGSSVNDIMGGMFAAIGILAALREREQTGRGKLVKSALFENTVFLVGQHMAQYAITGEAPPPMSIKKPAWGVYDIFETSDDRLFVGVVTDTQWEVFCREFGESELGADARLKTNTQRVAERGWLLPRLGQVFRRWTRAGLAEKLEAIGLPYAPIARPQDLFDDPHLNASGGLAEIRDPRGTVFRTPTLPLELDGRRLPQRLPPPAIGEGARAVLADLGISDSEIDALVLQQVVAVPQSGP